MDYMGKSTRQKRASLLNALKNKGEESWISERHGVSSNGHLRSSQCEGSSDHLF